MHFLYKPHNISSISKITINRLVKPGLNYHSLQSVFKTQFLICETFSLFVKMQKTAISLCISHTDHIIKGSFAAVAQKFQIKESWILIQKALKNTNKPAIVRRFNYYYKIYRIPLLSHYWRHMSGCPKYKIHRTEQQIKLNSNYIQIKEKQQKKNQWFDKKWQNLKISNK